MPSGTRATPSIAQVGEFAFLSRLLPSLPHTPGTLIGPGQDCAVIRGLTRELLLTVDALVDGVHYRPGWLAPRHIGRKSFLVNVSDIAAMGGRPRFCVVSLGVPRAYPARQLAAVERGIVAAASSCGTAVVGGNLTRAQALFVSIALLADAPRRRVTRQGARPGDRIYVTGTLGDAALAVRALSARRQPPSGARRRFAEPPLRLRAGQYLVEAGIVSAMIDVSDGLLQDLGHVCTQSRVGARVDASRIPVSATYRRALDADVALALSGGEDYELLCTVPERNVPKLERSAATLGCPITCIGEVVRGHSVRVRNADGRLRRGGATGYDHFRSPQG
jgi:thiamine-monophosphate kinase